jgi:hypothetical protein
MEKIKSASDAIIPVYVPAFALIGFCYLCIANPFLQFSQSLRRTLTEIESVYSIHFSACLDMISAKS